MQHLEGSGTPVLYIGCTVLKGYKWTISSLPWLESAAVPLFQIPQEDLSTETYFRVIYFHNFAFLRSTNVKIYPV